MTSSAWPSTGEAVGDGSCARLISGAVINQIPASQSSRPFCFHITSFPPFFERRTCLAEPHGPRLSFFFSRRSFFALVTQPPWAVPVECSQAGCLCHDSTNEVERGNILAPGFRR